MGWEDTTHMSLSEMDTVVKRILPYLRRREYNDDTDLEFEAGMKLSTRYANGYADILVTCGKSKPQFIIEAKRDSRTLTNKDRDQAIEYGKTKKTAFVVVTNGKVIQCYNTVNRKAIRWNGKLTDKIPSKTQLNKVLAALKSDPQTTDIVVGDNFSPFRPSLPLKQLNALFKRCHNNIRKIEKDEENAFADFSKFLFLKLLEEKSDDGTFVLPYSYRFAELAGKPTSEADQVKAAVIDMVEKIKQDMGYGDVLDDPLHLKKPKTFQYIVAQLSEVYFGDSNLDSKGAAFEYFVRATLKGKKLGQYFTPRPLIELMVHLYGRGKIVSALKAGDQPKVLDPACGTGGFLVYLLRLCRSMVDNDLAENLITKSTRTKLGKSLCESTFFGSDANKGVACSAKMNMIVAGDGHTNIIPEDSLTIDATTWSSSIQDCDLILTNPPFGTSESASLTTQDLQQYDVTSTKGQNLFLQKMVMATKPGGEICTVIDEGILNTDTAKELRKWLLQRCRLVTVVRLPEDTFKPNKINVRSSVLYMRKLEEVDYDFENNYNVTFCDVLSLGYFGSGEEIRNFDTGRFLAEIETKVNNQALGTSRSGYNWKAFDASLQKICSDGNYRIDLKYWEPEIRKKIEKLSKSGGILLAELNAKSTVRGKSPNADLYVDEEDGYAAVIKAGSSINKFGDIALDGDFIEEELYKSLPESAKVEKGDVLLASTGDGTLGKCGRYELSREAIADGHVTIIRPIAGMVDPNYLSDYLRIGFGAVQIQRLYSGSTGLIELTPEHVKSIVVDTLGNDQTKQRNASKALRIAEGKFRKATTETQEQLDSALAAFLNQ